MPKLVADDIPLLRSLLSDVFPGIPYVRAEMTALRAKICEVCQEMNLVFGENDAKGSLWVEKVCSVEGRRATYSVVCDDVGVRVCSQSMVCVCVCVCVLCV